MARTKTDDTQLSESPILHQGLLDIPLTNENSDEIRKLHLGAWQSLLPSVRGAVLKQLEENLANPLLTALTKQ